jgi:hypothetical protein
MQKRAPPREFSAGLHIYAIAIRTQIEDQAPDTFRSAGALENVARNPWGIQITVKYPIREPPDLF